MRPIRLYIKNFMCYEFGFINFMEFSSAIIIGKKENNDMFSNGVGKTTIFQAIEYVIFNQSDFPLERIVRDDTNECIIVLDFSINDQEYRLARSRTKKGTTDLVLLQRNIQAGPENEVYHSINNEPFLDKKYIQKYWKNISGSRTSDTEKDVTKLVKLTHKSFISTSLFPQNDFTGLPTATPEKRKSILKESFNLLVYAKLEKIAKDRFNGILKEIDKTQFIIDNLGDPDKDLLEIKDKLNILNSSLFEKQDELFILNENMSNYNSTINDLNNLHSNLESNFITLVNREKNYINDSLKLETSIKEYNSKKQNVLKLFSNIENEILALEKLQLKLIEADYSQIVILEQQNIYLKKNIINCKVAIKSNQEKLDDVNVPLPSGSSCKTCRKIMTDEEKNIHKSHLLQEKILYEKNILKANEEISFFLKQEALNSTLINDLKRYKQQLESVNTDITFKIKEVADKKTIYEEYSALWEKFNLELSKKIEDIAIVKEELKKSSLNEALNIKKKIDEEKKKLNQLNTDISSYNKEIAHINNSKAVLVFSFDQKTKEKTQKESAIKTLIELNSKLGVYPSVLQAFSTTGIPNLIIQNVLDDLQIEANNLLSQLKPGLQLAFSIEKTIEKTGDQADTLDLTYTVNGKDRYYKQLSGAMQIAVAFSLKLGLSFLLQKLVGADIKFLLLDELDQSLDKASVDAFVDIIKFFQKDFTILIITHNDRLKDKFTHAILVEQDVNMVSRAKVVSSW